MDKNKELINAFRSNIAEELNLCDGMDTPYLCANLQSKDGRIKIEKLIADKVINQHISISEAIVQIERDLNPNSYEG